MLVCFIPGSIISSLDPWIPYFSYAHASIYDRLSCRNFCMCASVHARVFGRYVQARAPMHARSLSRNIRAPYYLIIRVRASASILSCTSLCLFFCSRDSARIRARASTSISYCGGCYTSLCGFLSKITTSRISQIVKFVLPIKLISSFLSTESSPHFRIRRINCP